MAGASATPSPPAHTVHGGEFLSPSGNISCEIDNGYIGLHQVYCQTISPPESVVLSLTGTFKVCKGQQCLGNPAVNTPVLAYGRSTGSGPFRCLSTTAGVTCTAVAKGFQILEVRDQGGPFWKFEVAPAAWSGSAVYGQISRQVVDHLTGVVLNPMDKSGLAPA